MPATIMMAGPHPAIPLARDSDDGGQENCDTMMSLRVTAAALPRSLGCSGPRIRRITRNTQPGLPVSQVQVTSHESGPGCQWQTPGRQRRPQCGGGGGGGPRLHLLAAVRVRVRPGGRRGCGLFDRHVTVTPGPSVRGSLAEARTQAPTVRRVLRPGRQPGAQNLQVPSRRPGLEVTEFVPW